MNPLTLAVAFAIAVQVDSPPLAFEAATIRPFPDGTDIHMSGCAGGPGSTNPGQVQCEHMNLKMLLVRAYQVRNQEVIGPDWLEKDFFNINAKVPAGATKDHVPGMLQRLLAERFKVVLRRETRSLPAYSLTVTPSGLKIRPAASTAPAVQPGGGPPSTGRDGFPTLPPAMLAAGVTIHYRDGRARIQGSATVDKLAEALSRQLDRVVINDTDAPERYSITMYWTPATTEPGGQQFPTDTGAASDPEAPPSIFRAIEQQLGLRLQPTKSDRAVVVVETALRTPTEN